MDIPILPIRFDQRLVNIEKSSYLHPIKTTKDKFDISSISDDLKLLTETISSLPVEQRSLLAANLLSHQDSLSENDFDKAKEIINKLLDLYDKNDVILKDIDDKDYVESGIKYSKDKSFEWIDTIPAKSINEYIRKNPKIILKIINKVLENNKDILKSEFIPILKSIYDFSFKIDNDKSEIFSNIDKINKFIVDLNELNGKIPLSQLTLKKGGKKTLIKRKKKTKFKSIKNI